VTLFRAHGERDDPWRGAEGSDEVLLSDKRERHHTPLEDGEDQQEGWQMNLHEFQEKLPRAARAPWSLP